MARIALYWTDSGGLSLTENYRLGSRLLRMVLHSPGPVRVSQDKSQNARLSLDLALAPPLTFCQMR